MSQQPLQEPSQMNKNYQDFMSKFKKEAKYFENERTANGRQWPRIKPVDERVYDNWIAEVVDPVTGEYYKDANGNPARYDIHTIVRFRMIDGSEKLYSNGQLVGFDSFKDMKTYPCKKPETHIKTNFGHKKTIDKKSNQIKRVTTGPQSIKQVYDMDFTAENSDKLWSMKKDRNIQLVLKDELSNQPHLLERKGPIAANDIQKAFEYFKTKPFDYLYNWEYLKESSLAEGQNTAEQRTKLREAAEELKQARPDSSPNNSKTKFESEKVK